MSTGFWPQNALIARTISRYEETMSRFTPQLIARAEIAEGTLAFTVER